MSRGMSLFERYKEIIGFAFVGIANTGLTYILYIILLFYVPYSIAYTISYILGIVFSYFINTIFVFKAKVTKKRMLQFPLVYIVQYLFNLLLTYIYVDFLGIHERIALLCSIVFTVPLTFLLSKKILKKDK